VKRTAVLTVAFGLGLIPGAQPAFAADPTQVGTWAAPACGQVTGDVTFTWNAGEHLAATTRPVARGTVVSDVDTLATPNLLLSVTWDGRLSRSVDAGCTWTQVADLDGQGPFSISPAPDGTAYVWTRADDTRLYRFAGVRVTELPAMPVDVYGMLALVADPHDAEHLRAVDAHGGVLDSTDGGRTFTARGTTPADGSLFGYDAAVAPADLDHLMLGTMSNGAFLSRDGGATWTKAAIGGSGHNVNVFTVTMSPADPGVVWAMGLDITEMDSGARTEGRHIFRSTDGGGTFTPAVDHVPGEVTLTNGLPMVADPVDPARVYFEFGTWFAGYGTDLFSYDAASDRLTSTHNPYDDIDAMAFNPRFPQVMYLGLAEEN
jgi:hypothetical protein